MDQKDSSHNISCGVGAGWRGAERGRGQEEAEGSGMVARHTVLSLFRLKHPGVRVVATLGRHVAAQVLSLCFSLSLSLSLFLSFSLSLSLSLSFSLSFFLSLSLSLTHSHSLSLSLSLSLILTLSLFLSFSLSLSHTHTHTLNYTDVATLGRDVAARRMRALLSIRTRFDKLKFVCVCVCVCVWGGCIGASRLAVWGTWR